MSRRGLPPDVRRVTRNLVVVIALAVAVLLALGAVPSYLGGGESYHLAVEPTAESGPAVDASNVSARRFPYLSGALESPDGRSERYRAGRYGIKESFTHTPFDEVDALVRRVAEAERDDGVLIEYRGERYRVRIVRGDG